MTTGPTGVITHPGIATPIDRREHITMNREVEVMRHL